MSEDNVELVRRGIEALADSGPESLIELVHPDFEMTTPPGLAAEPDTYGGRDGIRRYFSSFEEVMDDIRFEARDVSELGDRVLIDIVVRARGRATGIEVEQNVAQVWEIKDGQVFRIYVFATEAEARTAYG